MSAIPTPDLAAFADSQQFLIDHFGQDIRFYQAADVIYDPSIPAGAFDDEGIPLDPLASGSSNEDSSVDIVGLKVRGIAKCNVVFKPLQTSILRRDQTTETELAMRSGLNRDLIVSMADYPLASGASHFQVGTLNPDGSYTTEDPELFRIVQAKVDSFGTAKRYIVYGQGTE